MDSLPADLPPETRDAYERYIKLPQASRVLLANKLDDYMETVLHASGENEFLDYPTAQKINLALRNLLEVCTDDQLLHVQAAAYYFVNSDDASPDLESILGFDDDAEVLNAVCRHLGHSQFEVVL